MKNVAIRGKYKVKDKSKFLGKRSQIYRSMWERRFMIYCDKSDKILKWDSEGLHIPYVSPKDDKWHNYYPDFYIHYIDKNGTQRETIVEIKPNYQKRYKVNKAKWESAQEYCKENNYEFKVLTEKELF